MDGQRTTWNTTLDICYLIVDPCEDIASVTQPIHVEELPFHTAVIKEGHPKTEVMGRPVGIIVRRSYPGHFHVVQKSFENDPTKKEIIGGEEGIDVKRHMVVIKVG
ncbi:MAG TPA: hypothetical protein G4O14_08115 [Anaerolineae bacterium]|nr:hypothetical protein [Anaerolineae bacterium]